jgi:hypothetical protein
MNLNRRVFIRHKLKFLALLFVLDLLHHLFNRLLQLHFISKVHHKASGISPALLTLIVMILTMLVRPVGNCIHTLGLNGLIIVHSQRQLFN